MNIDRRWLFGSAVLAVVVFVLAWIGWSTPWPWVESFDNAALAVTHAYGVEHPVWVRSWDVLCSVFSPVTFRVLALGVIVWAVMRKQWRLVLYLFLAVELPAVTTALTKLVSDRPRPDTALVYASSTSFPSGHALGTTAAVLALLAWALPLVRRRAAVIAAGLVVIVAVGVGRVVLNVHHPSDVVAGWALGYAWFAVTLPVLPVRAVAGTPVGPGSSP